MRSPHVIYAALLGAAALLSPVTAAAQYKNNSFGLDLGGWLITKPSVVDEQGYLRSLDERPVRLSNGLRLGGETNFKMADDHWWFVARVNVGILQYPSLGGSSEGDVEMSFDEAADAALGTLMGVQGSIGVRYVVLTDRFRPYLQGALSYMHLFSFATGADDACVDPVVCAAGAGSSNFDTFLPHNDIGGVHLQPGVELIFTRDIAFHVFTDIQRWIIFNAEDNHAVVVGLGMIFFT